jgi:hypothetical protein
VRPLGAPASASTLVTDASLQHAEFLLRGLQVNEARMRENLEFDYADCRIAREKGRPLREVLEANLQVKAALGGPALTDLGVATIMVDQVVAAANIP